MEWTEKDLEVKESLLAAGNYIQDILLEDEPLDRYDEQAKLQIRRTIKLLTHVFSMVWGEKTDEPEEVDPVAEMLR